MKYCYFFCIKYYITSFTSKGTTQKASQKKGRKIALLIKICQFISYPLYISIIKQI